MEMVKGQIVKCKMSACLSYLLCRWLNGSAQPCTCVLLVVLLNMIYKSFSTNSVVSKLGLLGVCLRFLLGFVFSLYLSNSVSLRIYFFLCFPENLLGPEFFFFTHMLPHFTHEFLFGVIIHDDGIPIN